ncbi:STAS domain-containing protein [Hydrogenophaga sp. 5NK40-0174]|uniref:STAS domain-containing protein n=1 Tax=Hydrogenophaga sp. 5NK40-0174 TaxID=3127649 RepID=UPI0031059840
MSNDDSNGGFLSKVVKFVRHPTTSWAELDTRSSDRESEYSKAALKEMVERKRRNDFVRKREFDMLRKIRAREGKPGEGPGVRPSFFQSSLPSKPDDRAMTLKKIDEIEAQMSMQWWKTKGPDNLSTGGGGGATTQASVEGAEARADAPSENRRQAQYKETEGSPLSMGPHSGNGDVNGGIVPGPQDAPTQPMSVSGNMATTLPPGEVPDTPSGPPPGAKVPTLGDDDLADLDAQVPQAAPVAGDEVSIQRRKTGLMQARKAQDAMTSTDGDFSASHFFALDTQEIAQDPEVEEASIRFANGDDQGAEEGLLEALGENGSCSDNVDDWLALFDLYRATGQLAPFESQAVDFVNRFGRSAPQWFDMQELVSVLSGKETKPEPSTHRAAWVSEEYLDAHAVGTLQNVLARVAQPWVIDWSPIQSIDQKAARALLGLLTLWADQDLEMRMLGAPSLAELLKELTPSGRRDVEQLWWELRLATLRLLNRADEFELAALDFCVTYEVSPPAWESPVCNCKAVAEDGSEEVSSVLGNPVREDVVSEFHGDSVMDSQAPGVDHLGMVDMSGEIRGDPQQLLDELDQKLEGADVFIISCRNLIRVDFSAAGTLLNWVSAHQGEGRMVQFVDVHRLISAFFNVIGITEYARVVVRND